MSRIIKEMINDIQPRKSRISEETKRLNEELVYADINELDREMNYNSTLKQLLYTKAVELPDKYKYLIGEIYAEYEDVCLYDLIKQSQKKLGKDKVFFSKTNERLVGTIGRRRRNGLRWHTASRCIPAGSRSRILTMRLRMENMTMIMTSL